MTEHHLVPIGELVESPDTWNPARVDGDTAFTYIDLAAVDQTSKVIAAPRQVLASEAPSRARQVVERRDVLVSTVRPNLNAVAVVPTSLDKAIASTGFCVLRPILNRLDSSYLFHWVRTPEFVGHMVRRATGASYPAVSDRIVRSSEIPLPPLPEQQRIARILDQADALRVKRRATLEHIDRLRRSIFDEMFGRGPNSPVTVSRQALDHREGWPWETLTDVARLATGHTPDREVPSYWDGDIPWISLTEIRGLDGMVADSTELHVSQNGIDHSSSVLLPAGTVCFSRTASIGFVTVMGRPMATSQDFVNWVCGDSLRPLYLMHALLRSREQLRDLSTGSTHKTIYMRVAEQFRVLVPPVALQDEFVSRIEALTSFQLRLTNSATTTDCLFASLQCRAFRGEL